MRDFKGEKLETLGGGYTSCKDIAIKIRRDIKDYKKKNNLNIKVSVKSTVSSIRLNITDFPTSFINQDYIIALTAAELSNNYSSEEMRRTPKMTEEAIRILEDIKQIHQAYNYDRSDIMTDYFDVNYYGQAQYCWAAINRAVDARRQGVA